MTHMLRCPQSPRFNVLAMYASARRFIARLASEIFLSGPQTFFISKPLRVIRFLGVILMIGKVVIIAHSDSQPAV